ncbi:Conserved_hypothetical protein [Hexamita inflata]|uniref:Uncharacterized protein n=1 Tax=Hexamita inflata TaxID=28002 RepID=A0ABP1KGV7_9EUKA
MIYLVSMLQLRCFQTNTTIMLDVQTREAILKAWPRTDSTRETELCQKLKGDVYRLSVVTGTYEYVLSSLQQFDNSKYLELRLPCTEFLPGGLPGTCIDAFKAKSAIYTMEFQEAQQNVTEAAQNLRRLDFDRKACYSGQHMKVNKIQVSPTIQSGTFQFAANTQNCRYPLDSVSTIAANNKADKKSTMTYFGYPNFTLFTPQYSIPLKDFLDNTLSVCSNAPVPAAVQQCNSFVYGLQTQSFSFFQMNYSVPTMIPDRNGVLIRQANYTIVMESNVVQNQAVNFDCYTNIVFKLNAKNIKQVNNLNASMDICKLPSMIDYDYRVMRLIFRENQDFRKGKMYSIDFKPQGKILNNTFEWLSCNLSVNESQCIEILALRSELVNFELVSQYIFYKNSDIQIVPLHSRADMSCFSEIVFSLSNEEVCAQYSLVCPFEYPSGSYQFTFSFGDNILFGSNLLNVTTQARFPNAENKYCAEYSFTDSQIQKYLNKDSTKSVTGLLSIGQLLLPVSTIVDVSKPKDVLNLEYILIAVAVIVISFVIISLIKPWNL